MAQQRVDRTSKESVWLGGQHPHIAALCLEDRRRVPKEQAIANVRAGRETYYTYAAGQVAIVEVVNSCSRCYSSYLRTNRDTTTKNNLLELPDCP